jgi:hypothetical protein
MLWLWIQACDSPTLASAQMEATMRRTIRSVHQEDDENMKGH